MCSKTLKCVSDLKGWECIKNMENDMARNTERDEREATRRKEQLMKAGFKLFSENGIENVSLQKVADAADVGVATMYKGKTGSSHQWKDMGGYLEKCAGPEWTGFL